MILAFIKMRVLPEKRKELLQTLHSIVAQMRKENGCVDSNFYQNAENENDLFLVEAWENRKALDDHLQTADFTVLMGAGSLLSRPPEIMIHAVSRSSELEPWIQSEYEKTKDTDVQDACGQPNSQNYELNAWVYNFGPSQPVYTVIFKEGQVVKILEDEWGSWWVKT